MAEDVKVVNEPDPWAPYKDVIHTPEELMSTPPPFATGIDPKVDLRTRNIKADELKEIADAASKKPSDYSAADKAMIEEYRYRVTGQYKRKYW